MRIAVIGAGAIGGLVGAKLALTGHEVTFMVRGAHLTAIRSKGFRLMDSDGRESDCPQARASDDYQATGPQDLVIIAVKAHHLPSVAPDIHHLLGPQTPVITMQNGIPYWYFHEHGGDLKGHVVASVDPQRNLLDLIPASRVLGCVVYPAAQLLEPGVVQHVEGLRLPLGELDGSASARVMQAAAALTGAGFKSPVLDNIRAEIWLKLWGNLTFNPISALTGATLADICQYPLSRDLAAAMMREAQQVAHELGIEFRVSLEKRIEGAEKVGHHKTSMLQDMEARRLPETDALVGSVIELGRLTNTPTPHIDAVHAMVKLATRNW